MIRRKTQAYNLHPAFTILMATMLATIATHIFLTTITRDMSQLDWAGRLILSLTGLAIYGGIAGGTFYFFLPQKNQQRQQQSS
jgi:hypothetical protein